MKAVAYSIRAVEKEPLVKANGKRHDITLISNNLNKNTIVYAEGKEAVLVDIEDDLSTEILQILKTFGIQLIVSRTQSSDHIDLLKAKELGIQIYSINEYLSASVAEQALTLMLALSRNVIPTHRHLIYEEFGETEMTGTTVSEKTIGILGFGNSGKALAKMLSGFNCRILVNDIRNVYAECKALGAEQTTLNELLKDSDIISIHLPLTENTFHLINTETINKMKSGVMLINVSRGEILNSIDLYHAFQSEKVYKVGMDVYQFENEIKNQSDAFEERILKSFIQNSRVILSPRQSLLTIEGLKHIAENSIQALDQWTEKKKLHLTT